MCLYVNFYGKAEVKYPVDWKIDPFSNRNQHADI